MARTRVKTEGGTPAEAAEKLDEAIQAAETETQVDKARQVVFDNANAAKETAIDARYQKLVEHTLPGHDWDAVLAAYEGWMELGDKRTEEGFIRKAHEQGPKIVQRVFDMYVEVKYAREVWELQNDAVLGDMRVQATSVLQGEKERGIRTKQITEKDVDSKCAALFTDEWTRQESKRLRFKLAEDRARFCIENAQLRCRVLDTMMGKLR